MASSTVADPDTGLSQVQLAAKYGLTVSGARPRLVAYTRSIWAYRHFIAMFANGGLVASFNAARLGRVWQVLTPLTNAAVYYLIFGVILDTKRAIPNFIAYLVCGVFIFNYTSQVLSNGVQAITKNLPLVRALHFPRASLPIAVVVTQFINLAVSMGVLAAIVLGTGEPLTLRWFLVIPVLALQSVFNAGLGMLFARVGNKITDLKQLMPFIMRVWMYSSGVMYSVTAFTSHLPHRIAHILLANPMVVYIQLVRHALLHSLDTPKGLREMPLTMSMSELWLLAIVWAVVLGVGGFLFFWRGEQEYGRG